MKHIDLFTGIGGFSIASWRMGWETVALCEVDPFCRDLCERRIARDRWISVPGHFTGGETLGLEGDKELARLDPDWVVLENSGHRWRSWVPELRRRLYGLGYASVPLRVRASEIGYRHRRSRVFVVAHSDSERLRELSRWWGGASREVAQELNVNGVHLTVDMGVSHGVSTVLDGPKRRSVIGNAVLPDCAELVFRGIGQVTKENTTREEQ